MTRADLTSFTGDEEEGSDLWDEKTVKPMALPHFSGEFRDLANIIQRVLPPSHLTHLDDITHTCLSPLTPAAFTRAS